LKHLNKKNTIKGINKEKIDQNFEDKSSFKGVNFIPNLSKFTLSKLYMILKVNQKIIKKDSFLYIGKIILKKKKNPKNIENKSKKYNFIYHHQYELRARILKEKDEEIMEIILNDISVLIRKEREKIMEQCRSMYLLKTAHELMNPITSSIELINIIEEEFENENHFFDSTIEKESILNKKLMKENKNKNYFNNYNYLNDKIQINKKKEILNYLKNLYFIMFNFLKDFTYFSEIKNMCKKCFNYQICDICKSEFLCFKCNNCKKCNSRLLKDINLKEIIEEIFGIFSNIIRFEGKIGLNLNLNVFRSEDPIFRINIKGKRYS